MPEQVVIELPELPGKKLISLGRPFMSKEGLGVLHALGLNSPCLCAACELRRVYPELYEHAALAEQLSKLGYQQVIVLVGLEEEDDWCNEVGERLVGCYDSAPARCDLCIIPQRLEAPWPAGYWLLAQDPEVDALGLRTLFPPLERIR